MKIEIYILGATTVFSLASVFYIPKGKRRVAVASFVTFQTLTWLGSLTLVQLDIVSFPFREFPRATEVGFLQNFVFFPTIYIWFEILYPFGSPFLKKAGHCFVFLSVIVVYISFISTYTNLEAAVKSERPLLSILRTYGNFLLYFLAVHAYVGWLHKKLDLCAGGERHAHP